MPGQTETPPAIYPEAVRENKTLFFATPLQTRVEFHYNPTTERLGKKYHDNQIY